MPTAAGLPMPMSGEQGFATGFKLGDSLIQNLMNRQKMQQQADQFAQELGFKNKSLAQQMQIHRDALAHQRMQEDLWRAQQQKYLQDAAWTQMLMGGAPNGSISGSPMSQPLSGAQPSEEQQSDYSALRDMFVGRGMIKLPEQSARPEEFIERQQIKPSEELDEVEVLQPGNPRVQHLDQFAGFKGIPEKKVTIDSDGNMITTYPSGKITKQKIAPSAAEKKRAEGLVGADMDVYKDVQKQAISSLGPQQTYSRIGKVLANPEWKNMTDEALASFGKRGRNLNLAYFRNLGTDAQKKLIGQLDTLSGTLVTQMASVFKGPFRVTEQSLIESIKPRPDDPLPVALGKLEELQRALDIETKVSRRMAQLMANEKKSALDAFDIAKDELNAPEFVDGLARKYGSPGRGVEGGGADWRQQAVSLGYNPEDVATKAAQYKISPEQYLGAILGAK